EEGQFQEGRKIGQWRYFYQNGQLKKIIRFTEKDYFLKEFYKKNGKQLVVDGNGRFVESNILPTTELSGEIKNGKQHGEWTIRNEFSSSPTAVEFFDNGKFIEGQNIAIVKSFNDKYTDYPRSLIDLTKDQLYTSYRAKLDCTTRGVFQLTRYNSQSSDLPF